MVNLAFEIANLPWMVSTLSNTQSLTHAACVGHGPIWNSACERIGNVT